MGEWHAGYLYDIKGDIPLTPIIFFSKRSKRLCSFLLTAEEKEPKKTVTPSPFKGDVNRETQKPTFLCNVLVSRDDGLSYFIN